MVAVPSQLAPAIEILSDYLQDTKNRKTVVAVGSAGCGRGHFVAHTIRAHGYRPEWCYEPNPIGNVDLDGNRLFPVYDIAEVEIPSPRSVVFAESSSAIPAKLKNDVIVVGFPYPTLGELEQFITAHGHDKALAQGQRTYTDAAFAMFVWDVAKFHWTRDWNPTASWSEWVTGGECPVDDGTFFYYAGYHNKPDNDDWNYIGWLNRRIPASVARAIAPTNRLSWEPGRVEFPALLRVRKAAKKSDRSDNPGGVHVLPPSRTQPQVPVDKSYHVDW